MKCRRITLNEIQEDVLVRLLALDRNAPANIAGELGLNGPEIRFYSEFRQYLISGHKEPHLFFEVDKG